MNNSRSPAPGGNFITNMIANNGKKNNLFSFGNNIGKNNSAVEAIATNATNMLNSAKNTMGEISGGMWIFIAFIIVLIALIAVFYNEITTGFKDVMEKLKQMMGAGSDMPDSTVPVQPVVTETPMGPQDENLAKKSSIVEKVLPGKKEVFNISQNKYTYYDAEPLCRALGAEVATYEQVKTAFEKGADWCNYGWSKGQMALYPTQEGTWNQLQNGPEDQRNACGQVGVNGGYFDNPELQFGVNCYGIKPSQKDHDAVAIAKNDGQPFTPGMLDFQKKMAKFRGEIGEVGLLPFNTTNWSE
jgi:hypothetical protein